MKCEELLALLNEYVDGTVDPAICDEFEKHMSGCNCENTSPGFSATRPAPWPMAVTLCLSSNDAERKP